MKLATRDHLRARLILGQWDNPEIITLDEAKKTRHLENEMGHSSLDPWNYWRVIEMMKQKRPQ